MTITICSTGYGRHCRDCELSPVCVVQPAEPAKQASMKEAAPNVSGQHRKTA